MKTYTICEQKFEIPEGRWPKLQMMRNINEAQRCKFIIHRDNEKGRRLYSRYYNWCCRAALPFVKVTLRKKYAAVGLDMLSILTDEGAARVSQEGGNKIYPIMRKYTHNASLAPYLIMGNCIIYAERIVIADALLVARALYSLANKYHTFNPKSAYQHKFDPLIREAEERELARRTQMAKFDYGIKHSQLSKKRKRKEVIIHSTCSEAEIDRCQDERIVGLLSLYKCNEVSFFSTRKAIPTGVAGIYFLWNADGLEYIGRGNPIRRRLYNHHVYSGSHTVGIVSIPNEILCHAIERALIALVRPPRNVQGNPSYG